MKTVHKFPINPGNNTIKVQRTGVPRHVGLDPSGVACIWIEVETTEAPIARNFYAHGTGHKLSLHALKFVGTYVEGSFVWHVYA